ncbi:hypothetical protein SUNI508_01695 [Seiridium unicorne]|uniref:Clr5 domain-containing protein n=1 Tax=Seiridium unicorne TaxID=138068 RepID=A0ABR2UP32_9PEZI
MSSRSEWRALRPRLKEWYIDQNLTIPRIVDMLRDNGKVTTQRTAREMLKELGLFKKCKPDDMRTALHLLAQLGYTDALMPPGDFPVQIRDISVPFKTIRNYYRRKNIYTPFAWLRTHPQDDFMPNSNVGLILDFAPDSDNLQENSASSTYVNSPTCVSDATSMEHRAVASASPSPTASLGGIGQPLVSPVFQNLQQFLCLAHDYSDVYLNSTPASLDAEPRIHRDTIHGQFGHAMQEGIAAVFCYEGPPPEDHVSRAFGYFQSAFGKVDLLLKGQHPMSLALVFSVVCEMAAGISKNSVDASSHTLCVVLSPVLSSLLKYFDEAAQIFLPRNHPISGMFSRLYSLLRHSHAENVLAYSLRATEILLNTFKNHHIKTLDTTSYWKLLYLKERYCDSLYHAQGPPEALRRQLLEEQERFYSSTSSNVLWTLTNVADDSLRGDRLSEAKMLYETALMRAESHAPYSRAKTRFAALEGLARVARREAQKTENEIALVSPGRGGVTSGDLCRIRYGYLQSADVLLGRACNEAQTFGSGNRRFIRVSKQRAIVQRESMAVATKDTKGCRVKSDTGIEKHS